MPFNTLPRKNKLNTNCDKKEREIEILRITLAHSKTPTVKYPPKLLSKSINELIDCQTDEAKQKQKKSQMTDIRIHITDCFVFCFLFSLFFS